MIADPLARAVRLTQALDVSERRHREILSSVSRAGAALRPTLLAEADQEAGRIEAIRRDLAELAGYEVRS